MGPWCCGASVRCVTFLCLFELMGHIAASSSSSSSSSPYYMVEVCHQWTNSISLNNSETFFISKTNFLSLITLDVSATNCDDWVPEKFRVNSIISSQRYTRKAIKDNAGETWFPIMFKYPLNSHDGLQPQVSTCKDPVFNVTFNTRVKVATFDTRVKVAKACDTTGWSGLHPGSVLMPPGSALVPDTWEDFKKKFFDDDGDDDTTEDEISRLNFNRNTWEENRTYTTSSYTGQHVIFIPVGAIIFLLSVCLRVCLCRKPKPPVVQQRVRTVTVVRRIARRFPRPGTVPVDSDEFVQVSQPTASDPTDLPPSYADIESELPPPSYDDVAKDMPEKPTEAEAPTQPLDSTPDEGIEGDLGRPSTRATLSRVFNADAMAIKSQFAFKPMKEEE